MRIKQRGISVRVCSLAVWITTLPLLVAVSPALAQQHVVTPATLQQAMGQQISVTPLLLVLIIAILLAK